MKVSKTQNKFSSVETKFEIEIIKNTITQKSKDDKAFFVCSRVIGISSRSSRIVAMLAQEMQGIGGHKGMEKRCIFPTPSPVLLFHPNSYSLGRLFVSPQASSEFEGARLIKMRLLGKTRLGKTHSFSTLTRSFPDTSTTRA